MALCQARFKIYAFLEKGPHFWNERCKQQHCTKSKWGPFSKSFKIWKWSSEYVLKYIKFWYADGRFSIWHKKYFIIAPCATLSWVLSYIFRVYNKLRNILHCSQVLSHRLKNANTEIKSYKSSIMLWLYKICCGTWLLSTAKQS